MKDRLEKIVLLPFTAGCISESSIPVVRIQHTNRSKQSTTNSAPTGKHEEEKKDEDKGNLEDEESLSGLNWKTTLPRFQKLFKNMSQLFAYNDEVEPEMEMDIGLPTDVKHVSHVGMDGCATEEEEKFSFLASEAHAHASKLNRLLETKCHFNINAIAQ